MGGELTNTVGVGRLNANVNLNGRRIGNDIELWFGTFTAGVVSDTNRPYISYDTSGYRAFGVWAERVYGDSAGVLIATDNNSNIWFDGGTAAKLSGKTITIAFVRFKA